MPKIPFTTTTTINKHHHMKLYGEGLREVLRLGGVKLPKGARLYVHIPGGGDYSNMKLELDSDLPIHVEWDEKETK